MKSLLLLGFTLFSLGNVVRAEVLDSGNSQTAAFPLIQAAKQLLSLDSYELESVMEIIGDIPGASFVSNAKIKTVVEAPSKFNSQITFVSPNGLEGKAYNVISDGNQVWIYSYTTNQYSVSNLKPFLQTREGFLLGTLSYFYLNTRSNIGSSSIVANFLDKLPEDKLLEYFQRFSNLDLHNLVVKNETIEGRDYKTYDINSTNQGFRAAAYINTEQGLERIHLSGTKDGLQLAVKEQIINQTAPESFPEQTFVFNLPDSAKQVEPQIIIAPF